MELISYFMINDLVMYITCSINTYSLYTSYVELHPVHSFTLANSIGRFA